MKRHKHSPERIVRKLHAGRRCSTKAGLTEVLRQLEISQQTWHRWRNAFGGMKDNDAKRLRRLFAISLSTIALFSSACTGGDGLTVHLVAVPPLGVSGYDTTGSYPQFQRDSMDLTSVNAAIRELILRDQKVVGPGGPLPGYPDPDRGEYAVVTDLSLMSVSSIAVSVLLKEVFKNPGGHAYESWIGFLLEVPSGRPIGVRALFAEPAKALRAISSSVRSSVLATYDGCRDVILSDEVFQEGFAPTVENYSDFALTEGGLVFGLSQGQVGDEACSRMQATVPWNLARPLLNDLGRRLVAAIRQPTIR